MGSRSHSALPPNWQVRVSQKYDREYYFNTVTRESRWDPPTLSPQLGAKHILAKHRGSRRPSSWREENITRSESEAHDIITGYLNDIEQCDNAEDKDKMFGDIAEKFSDCSSAKRGGDLGRFERGAMQKPFEDAVLALKPGEISKPIKTDSGVHIILRTH
ncbi:peptidyl-prolyl cis-trans isomerase Pin1 [Coemansia sp. RSA 2523]|nr:peptidyl-prolyl cis-trans isomerase Pin1 [Coemansia sp. RSA 1591]KAJ1762526.1 peptidyl-prolyl cis-trans isomerase Pin1 [Coemansia sp. RSA 1752]KAJ1776247.1 peptidyl-prolyl cis-trans isomerase Pin1 [Coemansia sp. RSA 1824]KAJ1806529.1 peptidyl-prolyl cis-trans isomerase Pin1 [Coemansia sp. RSA 2523]KAJ2144100.1 peptidyl-prolyl cis-trans isomerase Pin1 [Coemansia sp. RSA 564]KAJ2219759.1 peptidyl-prolyl cis-trans isomerase Pin1 [Coemansia sp. RSA 518]KAJ2267494.1 peptidyl-prolyl cis-trans is